MMRALHGCMMVLGLWSLLALSAAAQDAPADSDGAADEAGESRAQAFQAVDGAVKEDVPGGPLMVAAYAVIWLVIFGYVLRLVALQRRTLEEIVELKKVIEAAGAGSAAGGEDGDAGDG